MKLVRASEIQISTVRCQCGHGATTHHHGSEGCYHCPCPRLVAVEANGVRPERAGRRFPKFTPAGSYLGVRPRVKWSTVEVDRIRIGRAPLDQEQWNIGMIHAGAARAFVTGWQPNNLLIGGRVLTVVWCPREDLERVVEALCSIELGSFGPARRYVGAAIAGLKSLPAGRSRTKAAAWRTYLWEALNLTAWEIDMVTT